MSATVLPAGMNGITCVLSYQVADELEKGTLVRLLAAYEPAPLPVHPRHPVIETAVRQWQSRL